MSAPADTDTGTSQPRGAVARARYVRMSPMKVRRVVDLVRGKSVDDALAAERLHLTVAINYGGRDEILRAIRDSHEEKRRRMRSLRRQVRVRGTARCSRACTVSIAARAAYQPGPSASSPCTDATARTSPSRSYSGTRLSMTLNTLSTSETSIT
mgnify:CR=1 FL=1